MTLRQILAMQTADHFEYNPSIQVIPSSHPPSERNPQRVKQDMPQDGWHMGDSKAAREKALQDLMIIHQQMRRQFGKPELAYGANYPLYPSIWTRT